jgi:hypothetical protein
MAEIIWDGKYKDGKRVAPVRLQLPFQTVETVNESVQDRQKALDLILLWQTYRLAESLDLG